MNVVFSVVMSSTILIIYVSNLSYLFKCWPWLAITVSLILPVYKINYENEPLYYTDEYRALSFG